MFSQTVNKSDAERIFINITNGAAETITAHCGVFKLTSTANAASVSTNEYGPIDGTGVAAATCEATLVGLAYEDVAPGLGGICQIYGYHESVNVMRIVGSVTVTPGHVIGPGVGAASIGMSSTGLVDAYGPIVALAGIGALAHSLGTVTTNFANHVLIRCV